MLITSLPGTNSLGDETRGKHEEALRDLFAGGEEDEVVVLQVRVVPVTSHVGRDIRVQIGVTEVKREAEVEEEAAKDTEHSWLIGRDEAPTRLGAFGKHCNACCGLAFRINKCSHSHITTEYFCQAWTGYCNYKIRDTQNTAVL